MKHAILIIAHKNYSFLRHLIEYFDHDCYVFVHIDKKSNITKDEIASIETMPQVSGVYQKYSVHWGGFSILKCEKFLLKSAIEKCDADYFHLISGQDYPIKPLDFFLNVFVEKEGKEFFQFNHLPHFRWEKNTYDRFKYYYFFDFVKNDSKYSQKVNKIVAWQKKRGIKRRIPDYFDHLYGGSQWFSITRYAVTTLLNYTKKHPAFYRRLNFTFAPEECYISTVLKNLIPAEDIEPRNYRFIRWENENGSIPANLSNEHFHLLAVTDNLFARKMESSVSENLIRLIDEYFLKEQYLRLMENGGWDYCGYSKYTFSEPLFLHIHKFCIDYSIDSVIDIGCGPGYYVAALRRMKITTSGYDINPYTPRLSSLLLPPNDDPCEVADITGEIDNDGNYFDLVICTDVIQYVPKRKWLKSIQNISSLTCKYVLISLNDKMIHNDLTIKKESDYIIECFKKFDMIINPYLTNSFRTISHINKLNQIFYVFEKRGISISLIEY